jgi:hypothetical protein
MTANKRAAPDESGPLESNDLLAGKISSLHTSIANETQSGSGLRAHFDRAVDLLGQKAALAADIAEWRDQARGDGLVPNILLGLAREYLRDAAQRRKAAERAEIEEVYRNGLGLPLFDYARGAE